jgi:hypothetical protein
MAIHFPDKAYHEELVDSGTYDREQLRYDLLRRAYSAWVNKDHETASILLKQWNQTFPDNVYKTIELLVRIEFLDEGDED